MTKEFSYGIFPVEIGPVLSIIRTGQVYQMEESQGLVSRTIFIS